MSLATSHVRQETTSVGKKVKYGGATAVDSFREVFGGRRSRACRDHLGWHEIRAYSIDIDATVLGERAEHK